MKKHNSRVPLTFLPKILTGCWLLLLVMELLAAFAWANTSATAILGVNVELLVVVIIEDDDDNDVVVDRIDDAADTTAAQDVDVVVVVVVVVDNCWLTIGKDGDTSCCTIDVDDDVVPLLSSNCCWHWFCCCCISRLSPINHQIQPALSFGWA